MPLKRITGKMLPALAFCVLSIQSLLGGSCDTCAGWPSAGKGCTTNWPSAFNLDFGAGYRQDWFRWSIGIPEGSPNVLSQLEWKKLRIAQISGSAAYVSCRNYVIRLDAQYGQIYHGRVKDFDWEGDYKTNLVSLSSNNAGRGHVYDLSAAGGYRVTSTCSRFVATVLAGYSQFAQYLHMYDGHQIFPYDFRFAGLNSTYTTRWYGPWAGVDFEARVERCAFLFGGFHWHMLAYRGHGHWNLRPDISRFNHKAYGIGYYTFLGGKWEIWNNWSIGVMGSYRNFRTRHGHEHITYYHPEFGPIPVTLRFNQAKWCVYTVSGIIAWRF